MLHQDLTHQIIGAFYRVYNHLGFGFLEKVYERALLLELRSAGLSCKSQCPVSVYYHNQAIGVYYADIIVEDLVIVEIKAADCLVKENENQLINYLKATDIEVGVLLNFGIKAQFKRKMHSNDIPRKSV